MTLGKKIWWLPAILVAALLVALLIHQMRREPVYNGHNFSAWFHQAEMMPYVSLSGSPIDAIRAMGPDAVPLLAARVRRTDAWWVSPYYRRYFNLPPWLRHHLPMPRRPGARQEAAAMLLGELGADSRPAVPDLITAYNRAYALRYQLSPRQKMDWTAQFINPPAALRSRAKLPTPESSLRIYIVVALGSCGNSNAETIPLLFSAAHDSDDTVRGQALSRLRIGTDLDEAVHLSENFVFTALADTNAPVRATAANVLGRVGPGHPEVVAPLLKAMEDPDPAVRHDALDSLRKVKPDPQTVLPAIGHAVSIAGPSFERFRALQVLTKSVGMTNMLPMLNQALENRDARVRLGAIQVLSVYSNAANLAIPKLQELTNAANEPDESIRRAAANALQQMIPPKTAP